MTDFVLDASAYVLAFTETTVPARAMARDITGGVCHAPHLISAEIRSVARSKVRRDELRAVEAFTLVEAADVVVQRRYGHGPLVRLAWSLRDNLSFYDALYVALAATLGVPLLTADHRLARAPGLPCTVTPVT